MLSPNVLKFGAGRQYAANKFPLQNSTSAHFTHLTETSKCSGSSAMNMNRLYAGELYTEREYAVTGRLDKRGNKISPMFLARRDSRY